ncbi:hypothetical protein [Deinococcus sp. QL22]|uniref:hypothetical protein n=1 Tax=Deinococcus sp. QL22 TaxID=2939437 RepID=UPI00201838F3|nr:hypothetical protein [Deinococcus sp. QL22]UQN09282.1 hypothetical protein M1R55_22165 [Deinococcus sp. QL22]
MPAPRPESNPLYLAAVQRLAEDRIIQEIAAFFDPSLLPAMIDAYVEGYLDGKVPSGFDTPKAVAVAFLLGDGDRCEGSTLDIDNLDY